MKYSILIIGILLIINISGKGQQDDFEVLLSKQEIEKTKIEKHEGFESWRTYLGNILDAKGNLKYYVIKEYFEIQAAIVKHGNTRLCFLDKDKKLVKQYLLSSPEELPFLLKNNTLYFRYREQTSSKSTVYKQKISEKLPSLMCVEPNNCY
jgi:hypothetical protein